MRRTIGMLLAVLTLAGVAAADDTPIPPVPPTWKGDQWSWERAVRRCYERPTQWARDRCMRGLYE